MTGRQYNNVINWTLRHEEAAKSGDSLETARAIFKNMGVALPKGDSQQVFETLRSDDYMGWRSCTMEEAQEAANDGEASIGINGDRIVVLTADTSAEEEVTISDNDAVVLLKSSLPSNVTGLYWYYTYKAGSSVTQYYYGCGGDYHANSDPMLTCFEYAMRCYTHGDMGCIGIKTSVADLLLRGHETKNYQIAINDALQKATKSYRLIEAHNSPIYVDHEYRFAVRVPNDRKNGKYYHCIYQLSNGRWAGKDDFRPSAQYTLSDPCYSAEMWSNDDYPASAGTLFYAITPKEW